MCATFEDVSANASLSCGKNSKNCAVSHVLPWVRSSFAVLACFALLPVALRWCDLLWVVYESSLRHGNSPSLWYIEHARDLAPMHMKVEEFGVSFGGNLGEFAIAKWEFGEFTNKKIPVISDACPRESSPYYNIKNVWRPGGVRTVTQVSATKHATWPF